jgi:hypothetical protein
VFVFHDLFLSLRVLVYCLFYVAIFIFVFG